MKEGEKHFGLSYAYSNGGERGVISAQIIEDARVKDDIQVGVELGVA